MTVAPHLESTPLPTLRALFLVGSLARGGAERQALLTTAALRARGVDARLHALAPPFDQLVDHPELADCVVERTEPRSLPRQLAHLERVVARLRPDVLVTFLAGAHVRALVLRSVSAAARAAAWVVAERGNTRLQMLGASPVTFALRMASFRAADRIVANSASLGANVAAFEPAVGHKLAVIPNVVLPAPTEGRAAALRLLAASLEIDGATPLLGALGSFQEERNYSLLARSLPAVIARHPRARLVVIGRARGGVFAEEARRFEAIARAAGVGAHVSLVGEIPDARRALAAFDVVIQPSKLEGSSNALVEALAAGAAIATTPVGDAAELVGEAAVVSGGWTPFDLSRAILEAIERAPELRALARGRFERLASERSAGPVGDAWRRLFLEILDERRAARRTHGAARATGCARGADQR